MTIQSPLLWLLFLIIVVIAFARMFQRRAQSEAAVNVWMEERGYTLLRCERRSMLRGPYSWWTSKNQLVYYLVVEDATGHQQSGWTRCGGWWGGMALEARGYTIAGDSARSIIQDRRKRGLSPRAEPSASVHHAATSRLRLL